MFRQPCGLKIATTYITNTPPILLQTYNRVTLWFCRVFFGHFPVIFFYMFLSIFHSYCHSLSFILFSDNNAFTCRTVLGTRNIRIICQVFLHNTIFNQEFLNKEFILLMLSIVGISLLCKPLQDRIQQSIENGWATQKCLHFNFQTDLIVCKTSSCKFATSFKKYRKLIYRIVTSFRYATLFWANKMKYGRQPQYFWKLKTASIFL